MRRLIKYKTSKINQVRIQYGDELIRFNLFEETVIVESKLMKEMKYQPSYYGFLLLVHKGLLAEFEKAKHNRKRIWGDLYLTAKGIKGENGRLLSDDGCKAYAESHKNFIKSSNVCIKIKLDADRIYSCVRAFEQRKDLMQTISSNKRNEKF